MGFRIKILAGLVLVMFAALTTRLWFLQVLATERYRTAASSNYVRLVKIPAPRGQIVDDQGNVLVDNQTVRDVFINRNKVGGNLNQVLARLSPLVHVPAAELAKRLSNPAYYPYTPVPVASNVPLDVAFAVEEHPAMFPGVSAKETQSRTFPFKDLAPHLLGYTGPITAEEAKLPQFANYDTNATVGQAGLERQYDGDLQGTDGLQKFQINAQGQNLGQIGDQQAPVPGNNVVLTLDAAAQTIAQDALATGIQKAQAAGFPGTAGTVIVLDPKTGGIVALANQPTFDPRVFLGGLSSQDAKQLGLDKKTCTKVCPLLNRAIDGQYPAGSTIKPFIGLAALKAGFATENSTIPCNATFKVPGDQSGTVFKNWAWPADLGNMNISTALIQSCDTVFYQFGLDFYYKYVKNNGTTGQEILQNDLKDFGFGTAPKIDFPLVAQDAAGLVPDQAWKQRTFPYQRKNPCAQNWCPGDYIQMAIGQGDFRVTPLQLAMAYSALANDGTLCQPHLGMQIQSADGSKIVRQIQPDCSQHIPYSQEEINYIDNALRQVPISGTAAPAFQGFPFGAVQVAGKTGTAEATALGPNQTDSWFAAMTKGTVKVNGNSETKDYVVVAMIERGGHGAETAAPVVRQVIEGLYGLKPSGFHLGTKVD